MIIKQGEEWQEINLPITELIQDEGQLDIWPTVKNYFKVEYKSKNDRLTLIAGQFIGLIPINERIAVEIKPKFSIANLTRLVTIAEDRFNTLSFFSRRYRESGERGTTVFEFIVECLANELQALHDEGILKTYQLTSVQAGQIKGKIRIGESINQLWAKGHFHRASIDYHTFTSDNPFNRLIKYTLYFSINELARIQSKQGDLRERLIAFYEMMTAVPLDHSLGYIDYIHEALRQDKIATLRRYYVDICEICRLIVAQRGVNFERFGDDITLNSFTINLATTFEAYIRNVLRNNRHHLPKNCIILDGNKEGKKRFYNQPTGGFAKPDIVLKRDGTYQMVIDVKYKRKVTEQDRYQIISHALCYGAKIGVLILPSDRSELVRLGSVGTDYEVTLYLYYIDLENCDLIGEERKFVDEIGTLLLESA